VRVKLTKLVGQHGHMCKHGSFKSEIQNWKCIIEEEYYPNLLPWLHRPRFFPARRMPARPSFPLPSAWLQIWNVHQKG